jgi:hypothetical protein
MEKQKVPEVGVPIRRALSSELRSVDEGKRQLTVTASTEKIDRYGDCIRANGWRLDAYKLNPVVLWGHRASEPAVGKTVKIWIEQSPRPALVQVIEFATKEANPLADVLWRLYKDGFMSAVSVGFLPLEQPTPISDLESNTVGYEFTSQELLELSLVSIPANSECLTRARTKGFSETDLLCVVSAKDEDATPDPLADLRKDLAKLKTELAGLVAEMKSWKTVKHEESSAESDICTLESLCDAVAQAGTFVREKESELVSDEPEIETIDQLGEVLKADEISTVEDFCSKIVSEKS